MKRLDVSRSDSGLMESPLNFNKQMVVPLLNPELSSQEWPELAFYFVAVRPEGVTGETIIDVIISKEGKPVGHMGQRPLPPPDDKGRIPYLAKLPLTTFGTGNFDVNVLVQNGDVSAWPLRHLRSTEQRVLRFDDGVRAIAGPNESFIAVNQMMGHRTSRCVVLACLPHCGFLLVKVETLLRP